MNRGQGAGNKKEGVRRLGQGERADSKEQCIGHGDKKEELQAGRLRYTPWRGNQAIQKDWAKNVFIIWNDIYISRDQNKMSYVEVKSCCPDGD